MIRRHDLLIWAVVLAALTACCLCPIFGNVVRQDYTVHGTSMEPLMYDGDHVRALVSNRYEDVKAGYPCVYRHPCCPLPVLHRAIRQYGWPPKVWVMRGDNDATEDSIYMTPNNFVAVLLVSQVTHP